MEEEGQTNHMWAYFKPLAILMVIVALPIAAFILLLPLVIGINPFLLVAFAPLYLVYIAVVMYWFFKKSGLYGQWKAAAITYGMQRSRDMMKDIPDEKKKEMMKNAMQNDLMKEFREELKQELKKEMLDEAQKPQN